jgi:hypothetical protein
VATVLCPAGKRVIGGGADIDFDGVSGNPNVYLNNSSPVTQNGQTGWTATAVEDAGGVDPNWTVSVYAVCAVVT